MTNFTDTYIKGMKPRAARYEEYEGQALEFASLPMELKAGYTVTK